MPKRNTSIRIDRGVYDQLKALSDETDLGIGAIADSLIKEGLGLAENAGEVVFNNPDLLGGMEAELGKLRKNQQGILSDLQGVQGKIVEMETEPGIVRDGSYVECGMCHQEWSTEEKPKSPCPFCGQKLSYLEDGKKGSGGGWLLAGVIALIALGSLRNQQAGRW